MSLYSDIVKKSFNPLEKVELKKVLKCVCNTVIPSIKTQFYMCKCGREFELDFPNISAYTYCNDCGSPILTDDISLNKTHYCGGDMCISD